MAEQSSNKIKITIACLRVVAVLIGLMQAYAHRFTVYDDDAISYLDIASAYLRSDWGNAINGYWSPFYSWLLAGGIALFHPSPYWEFAFLKAVNFGTFILLIVCFEYFLRMVLRWHEGHIESGEFVNFYVPSVDLIKLNLYIAFVCMNLAFGGVYQDTPDFLLSAFILLASALLLDLSRAAVKLPKSLMMAAVLALAYLSKAVAFPIALFYIFLLAVTAKPFSDGVKRAALALAVFVALVAPFVTMISTHYGHLTFSETGKIAYCEAVSKSVPFLHPLFSRELAEGCQHLLHPSRVLFDNPKVFEFAEPVAGTFPVWYDPSYWYAGCEIKYSNLNQFVASFCSAYVYLKLFFGPLLVAWLVMAIIARQRGLNSKLLDQNIIIFAPGVVALTCYLIGVNLNQVYPFTYRYLPAYFLQILTGLALSLRLRNEVTSKRAVIAAFAVVNIFLFVPLAQQCASDAALLFGNQTNLQWKVASDLARLNLNPGDRIALLDNRRQYYWARLSGLKIVAEIFDVDAFFKDYKVNSQKIFDLLKKHGVKAVVLSPGLALPAQYQNTGWTRVGEGECTGYVYPLDASNHPAAEHQGLGVQTD